MTEVVRTLVREAKSGKAWAVRELLDRLLGKAKASVEVTAPPPQGDPFRLLRDPEVTRALDEATARLATGGR